MDAKDRFIKMLESDGDKVSRDLLNMYLSGARNTGYWRAKRFSKILDCSVEIWLDRKRATKRFSTFKRWADEFGLIVHEYRGRPKKNQVEVKR